VKGSGADIWGTADEFHFVEQFVNSSATGDFDLVTRVDSVQAVHAWTKAGLMVRSSLNADSPQASVFVTPGKGIAFQRRTSAGATSVNTSGPLWTAPVWLRLSVRGKVVVAYYKKNESDAWVRLGDDTVVAGYAGLAVSSHADGTTATAAFSNVSLAPREPTFTTALIGSTIGSATIDGGSRYTIMNRGADVWGASDQLTLVSSSWYGDGTVAADVRSIANTSVWAKAGVMFRASTAANASHVSLFVTPGKGIAMQYRSTADGASAQVAQVAGVAPVVLMLTRTGNTFTGAWTIDLTNWHTVGVVTVAMDKDLLAGAAVTSHNTSATTTATIENPAIYHP
jgi:hypothetical protein